MVRQVVPPSQSLSVNSGQVWAPRPGSVPASVSGEDDPLGDVNADREQQEGGWSWAGAGLELGWLAGRGEGGRGERRSPAPQENRSECDSDWIMSRKHITQVWPELQSLATMTRTGMTTVIVSLLSLRKGLKMVL